MIQLHSTSGQLLSWLLSQVREEGLFPTSKGWTANIQIQKFQANFFYQLVCEGEGQKINFVILEEKGFFPLDGAKNKTGKDEQTIVFCSERLGQGLEVKAIKNKASLLVMSDGGVKFLSGEFASKRIEYRLLQQKKSAQRLPQPFGSISSLHLEGEEALSWQQPFWQQITHELLQGHQQMTLEALLEDSLALWPILPKGERKKLVEAASYLIKELMAKYFAGLLVIDLEQGSGKITMQFEATDKKAMAQWHRAIKQAMNWTKVEQPQLEFSGLTFDQ